MDYKATYRRFVEEVINGEKYELADELIAPDFVDHTPQPGTTPDRAGYIEGFRQFRVAFPDAHVTIDDLVQDGDRVAGRGTLRATHTGPLAGPMGTIPPTGKPVEIAYINVIHGRDGKAVASWAQLDMLGMLVQLGLVPPPGQPPA